MPAKNVTKVYLNNTYYHVYNRGHNKQNIFLDEQDFTVFLSLLKRYLDPSCKDRQANRMPYPCLADEVELIAYCLMPNHFHLFIYQHSEEGMKHLLRRISGAYGMYFNKKYKRVGPVFQQRYRAVRIAGDEQLMHISRYIHLNPSEYTRWQWSSLKYYRSSYARWLKTNHVLELFDNNTEKYLEFVSDYEDKRDELQALKQELAG